jgi:large subunit ribosomal protein L18e
MIMKRTGPTNIHLCELISKLKELSAKQKAPIWKRIAEDLETSTRKRRVVNLSRINRFSKENDMIVVPGKVLSSGNLDKKLTVAAWDFSEMAKKKIKEANSKAVAIEKLIDDNPKGKDVKIIG